MNTKVIILLVLSFLSFEATSQSISRTDADALNAYTIVSNECVEQLSSALSCLAKFKYTSLAYQENQKDGFSRHKTACIEPIKTYYLQQVAKKATELTNSERALLDEAYQDMLTHYELIVEACRALSTYANLQEYKTDPAQELVAAQFLVIQEEYQQFRATKRILDKVVYSLYRKKQPFQKQHVNHVAEQQMRDAIARESKMMDNWAYNLRPTIATTGIPQAALLQNVNQVDSIFQRVEIPRVSLFYKQFVHQIYYKGQSNKRYWLNNNTFKNRADDGHANSGYAAFLANLNHVYLNNLNKFSTANDAFRGVLLSAYAPTFIMPETPVMVTPIVTSYESKEMAEIAAEPKIEPIPLKVAFALNSYIEFVNHAVRVIKNMPRVCQSYNRSLNSAFEQDRNPSGFRYEFADIPLFYYNSALFNSKFIPEPNREVLKGHLNLVWQIVDELYNRSERLKLVTHGEGALEPTYEFIYGELKQIALLLDRFTLQTDRLFNALKTIEGSYKQDGNQPWVPTVEVMTSLMDESRAVVQGMRNYFRDSTRIKPSIIRLNELAKQAYLDKYDHLEKIDAKKYASTSSKVESYYNDIIDGAKQLEEMVLTAERASSEASQYKVFDNFRYRYNQLVGSDFNPMIEVSDEEISEFEFFNPYINFKPLGFLKHQELISFYNFIEAAGINQEEEELTEEEVAALYTSMEGYAVNHLVLLLDVSSSMRTADRLPLLQQSLKRLLGIMREEDKISIVIYSEKAAVVLKNTSCTSRKVVKALDRLTSAGSTHFYKGLALAFEVADKYFIAEGNNRIILATDGQFTLGDAQLQLIQEKAAANIALSVFYYGHEEIVPEKLQKIAEAGRGRSSAITTHNAAYTLIKEAKAKRQ